VQPPVVQPPVVQPPVVQPPLNDDDDLPVNYDDEAFNEKPLFDDNFEPPSKNIIEKLIDQFFEILFDLTDLLRGFFRDTAVTTLPKILPEILPEILGKILHEIPFFFYLPFRCIILFQDFLFNWPGLLIQFPNFLVGPIMYYFTYGVWLLIKQHLADIRAQKRAAQKIKNLDAIRKQNLLELQVKEKIEAEIHAEEEAKELAQQKEELAQAEEALAQAEELLAQAEEADLLAEEEELLAQQKELLAQQKGLLEEVLLAEEEEFIADFSKQLEADVKEHIAKMDTENLTEDEKVELWNKILMEYWEARKGELAQKISSNINSNSSKTS
jgi:hypothetical protein